MGEQADVWPGPAAPPGTVSDGLSPRFRWAIGLSVVGLALGGLAVALFISEGSVALSGQRAVAQVDYCGTGRHHSCTVSVRSPTGTIIDRYAEMPNASASEGDELRVRYRNGTAVPDGADRLLPLLLVTALAVGSAVALVSAVASAVGRGPVESRG